MFLLNGQTLQLDTPFTHNGFQYPANWLRLSSEKEKMLIGITEVPDPVRADDRYYWDGDVNNPRDLDQLKAQFVAEIKRTAGLMLADTDWYIVRKMDVGTDVPTNVAAKRAQIRAKADEVESTIMAAETVADLQAVNKNIEVVDGAN